ncbi:MAG: hypothetical protein C4320_00875 [Armatimonadota bacterium]
MIGANRFLAPTGAGAPIEGGLVALQYGPMDFDPNSPQSAVQLSVYGPNMSRVDGPRLGDPFNPVDVPTPAEYRISDPGSADALLTLPADTSGSFRLSLAAYFNIGGAVVRREITDLPPIFVTANANKFEAFNFRLIPGLVPTGATFVGVDLETVQVARNFDRLPSATAFDPDNSFQYKLVSGNFGFILFNSSRKGYDYYQVQSSSRQAFPVRINYDVYDWRILHEDFVVPSQEGYADAGNPNATGTIGQPATLRLAVTPMKSTSLPGADGLRLDGIEFLLNPRDGYDPRPTSDPASDHFILLDLETGGVFYESFGGQRMIEVNKSTGLIRFPVSTNGRASGRLYLPDGTSVAVPMEGRSVRALYMGRDEWAMQVLRAPAHYTRFFPATATDRPGNGTYYIGGTGAGGFATRLYFPLIDRGRKVSVTRIAFLAGGNRDSLEAVDAVLKTDANDPLGLPFLDIRDVNGNATGFDLQTGFPVRDVRGASAAVRVFHNDTKFRLTSDGAANVRAFERYLRLWKVDTKETYLTDGVR